MSFQHTGILGLEPEDIKTAQEEFAKDVNGEAVAAFFTKITPWIHNYLIKKGVQDSHIREDIAQNTLLKIFKVLDTFNPEKGKMAQWLSALALHEKSNYFRRKATRPLLNNEYLDETPSRSPDTVLDDLIATEEHESLWQRLVEKARPGIKENTRTQAAFARGEDIMERLMNGKSPEEIATDLEIPRDLVYLTKYRFLKRVRESARDNEAETLHR